MDTRKPKVTYLMVAGALSLAAWAASAMPRTPVNTLPTLHDPEPIKVEPRVEPPTPVVQIPKAPPKVEIVFALDTTGSMSGMIEGAKRKIWSIATLAASAQPKPEIRIGLVAYRDVGDEYVTRFYDLSDDMDTVFERLASFRADGGGDTPEHVGRALSDAINRASWTSGQGAVKIVYLVGDAPPHFDYHDGTDINAIARRAKDMNIHINTIRCGTDYETASAFKRIANLSVGEYASIDQSGGVKVVATPFDDKLAELNSRLSSTAIGYGSYAGTVRAKAAASAAMPKAEAADRASFFGLRGGAVSGEGDVVNDSLSGKLNVATAPAASLPAEMRTLDADGRKDYVEKKAKERSEMQREINALAAQRNEFLKKAPKKADALDTKIEETIKRQGAEAGLAF